MKFPVVKPIIALVGPTAVGKTNLSLSLAEQFNCEIINLDSMQVYRYMDIGTAKVTLAQRSRVVHHLIDIVDPSEAYDANAYVEDALQCIDNIHKRNKIPLLIGGTGLYLRSLIYGLFDGGGNFPEIRGILHQRLQKEGADKLHEELLKIDCISARRIHMNDSHRLIRALEIYYATGKSWSDHIARQTQVKEERFTQMLKIGLTCERNVLYKRINSRSFKMVREGLVEEVESLLSQGYHKDLKSMQAIGYRHIIEYLLDKRSLPEAEKLLARDTRRYAKRQYTWFRKMAIKWFDITMQSRIHQYIELFIKKKIR